MSLCFFTVEDEHWNEKCPELIFSFHIRTKVKSTYHKLHWYQAIFYFDTTYNLKEKVEIVTSNVQ